MTALSKICPICGQSSRSLFKRVRQLGSVHMDSALTKDLCMEGCCSCEFIWNETAFANMFEFESWMASAYKSYQLLSNDLHEFPFVDPRAEMAKEFLDQHCDWHAMRHVLEIGSNRGDFLAYLHSSYPHLQVLGVESTPLDQVGIPTLFGDVRNFSFSASFDLIVVRQVLEHILKPKAFLRHIASFLKEGGLLLLEVPDLENDLDEGVDPWVMEHVGYYSEKSLAMLGDSAGLGLTGVDRSYQLIALFSKSRNGISLQNLTSHGRWERLKTFAALVANSRAEWLGLVRQGYELCFYGASNVFLAITGELQQSWAEEWYQCSKSVVDDYSEKKGCLIAGIKVKSWDEYTPGGNCIYIVCAMYRYHRQSMMQRVFERMRKQDKVYAMWTPQFLEKGHGNEI